MARGDREGCRLSEVEVVRCWTPQARLPVRSLEHPQEEECVGDAFQTPPAALYRLGGGSAANAARTFSTTSGQVAFPSGV